jgi:hypothetical protein
MANFLNKHTNNAYYVSQLRTQGQCYDFPYALAGIEPGSSDTEVDAMSTAPRRQG